MKTTSEVVQPLYKSKTPYHTPTTKHLPDYLRNNQTIHRKILNYHPHIIHWIQNTIRVPEGSTTRLCVNPQLNQTFCLLDFKFRFVLTSNKNIKKTNIALICLVGSDVLFFYMKYC